MPGDGEADRQADRDPRRAPAGRRASAAARPGRLPASARSTPSTWRSSSIVWRPVRSTFSSSAVASVGRVGQVAPRRRGLDDHHADRVGDDVVQLAGDAVALLGDALARQQVPFALGPLGAVGQRFEVIAAPPQVVAEDEAAVSMPMAAIDVDDGRRRRRRSASVPPHEHDHRCAGAGARPPAPLGVGAERVDADEDGEPARADDVPPLAGELAAEHERRATHDRVPAAERDRHRRQRRRAAPSTTSGRGTARRSRCRVGGRVRGARGPAP